MRAQVEALGQKLARVYQGGDAASRDRHIARGKLLVRDRIKALLDPDSPWLELSPLAAFEMYDNAVPAAGIVTGPAAFPVLVYDRPGVALTLAFAWKEFPFLVLTALAILDTRTDLLADVARTLGASKRQIFRRVTWPLLWRGLSPAVIAAFAFLIGQYEMAALLAPSDPTPLSVLTFERASDPLLAHRGDAHVLGLLALMLAATLVVVHERLRRAAGGAAS